MHVNASFGTISRVLTCTYSNVLLQCSYVLKLTCLWDPNPKVVTWKFGCGTIRLCSKANLSLGSLSQQ